MSLSWRNNSQASLFGLAFHVQVVTKWQAELHVYCTPVILGGPWCGGRGEVLSISTYTPLLTHKSRQTGLQTETSATKDPASRSFLTVSLSHLTPPKRPQPSHLANLQLTTPWDETTQRIPLLLFQSTTRSYHPWSPWDVTHTGLTHFRLQISTGLQESLTAPTCSLEQGLGEVQ